LNVVDLLRWAPVRSTHNGHTSGIQSVANILDHEIHTQLGEAVRNQCHGIEPSAMAIFLLATIVSNSQETLDTINREIMHAGSLLEEHGDMWTKLKEAWDAQLFKEIRNMSAISIFLSGLLITHNR
jgi:hypothetical protein